MIVVLTAEAEFDFESIGDWIAKDNPLRALSYVQELRQACMALADAPKAYPVVARFKSHCIRKRAYDDYLIFYRVSERAIEILHVLHGARDYDPILAADLN